jgi:hypothetical protein
MLVTNGRSIREFSLRSDDMIELAEARFARHSEGECRSPVSPDACP